MTGTAPDPTAPPIPAQPDQAVNAVRVLVAAPYPMARLGLAAMVTAEPGLRVVAEAATLDRLLSEAETLVPQVVLLDPGDAADPWLEGLWSLGGSQLLPPVLMLAGGPEQAREALRSGIRGLLLRDATPEEISLAVRAVAAGLVVLDRRLVELVAEPAPEPEHGPRPYPPEDAPVEALTSREREVLELIARGMPNKSIALELRISEHTVKFHVGSILAKLGASSRSEALARAARLGLIAL